MRRCVTFLLVALLAAMCPGCSRSDADPVGTWAVTGDWECDGTRHYAVWHVRADRTFVDTRASQGMEPSYAGAWEVDGNKFTLTYSSGTRYAGAVDGDAMSGTCTFHTGGETGCWTAQRTSATP